MASLCNAKTKISKATCNAKLVRCANCGTVGCKRDPRDCDNSIQKVGVGSLCCKVCGKGKFIEIP